MTQEVSFDTPIDASFKLTDEYVQFLIDNIRLNSLSLIQPVACCQYFYQEHYLAIIPVFFAVPCDWRVHLELGQSDNGWCWKLHCEPSSKFSLKGVKREDAISELKFNYAAIDMCKWCKDIFPAEQHTEIGIDFKSEQTINTLGDAIEVFDEFYSMLVEHLLKEDINEVKSKYPNAVEVFELVHQLTSI